MPTTNTSKGLKRTALSVALSLCIAGTVYAQSSTGTIFGQAESGATVTIENVDTGSSRTITAGADGRFRLPQLQTGNYRVTSGGDARDVVVRVGTNSQINFAQSDEDIQELGATTVRGVATSGIDVSTVESTAVFTKEEIDRLPVGLNVSDIAMLSPGTVKGDNAFGNLVSFGGASVAENGYYINGFDVTNIYKFVSFVNLPYDGIAEQQVKTGGYGAEYGRSLGGIVSIVSKRGTNDFHFGGTLYWSPDALRGEYQNGTNMNPNTRDDDPYTFYNSENTYDRLTYDAWASGPIIKDRLFFFALAEGRSNETNDFNDDSSYILKESSPNGMLKLDWNITDDHLLEFTGLWNKTDDEYQYFSNPKDPATGRTQLYTGQHGTPSTVPTRSFEYGGHAYIGKYTGYLTDTFTLSAMYGDLEQVRGHPTPFLSEAQKCPIAIDVRDGRGYRAGCWDFSDGFRSDPSFGKNMDTRKAFRLDAEWFVGDHLIRFGYDQEKFSSGIAGRTYSGGEYWRYYTSRGQVNGVAFEEGREYVRRRVYETESSTFELENTAFYLEDNWQVTDNLMLYLGLRSEGFENFNGAGESFIKADNLFAPRLGFSWDVNGDGSLKAFGSAGRYFIPIATNTNIRAAGYEYLSEEYFTFEGIDPVTYAPIGLGDQIGSTNINGSRTAPNAATVADNDLQPMYQDEFILGVQNEFAPGWVASIKGTYRSVKNGMEDYCSHQPFLDWARDNGHNNFDPDSMAGCFVLNPGRDVNIAMDLNNDGNFTNVTVPASYLGLPEVERYYRAIDIGLDYNGAEDWGMTGYYTWSRSYGNYEGYVNSTLGQDDAGLVQDFDNALFEDGAYGYLPNDRRHAFKLFGYFNVTDEWTVSGAASLVSGRPVSCNGYIPLSRETLGVDYGTFRYYGASSFYCADQEGNRRLTNRGEVGRTPWQSDVDVGLSYTPNWMDDKLTFKVDVFNLLDSSTVLEYYERSEVSRDGDTVNYNYLQPSRVKSPRSVRFTVRYKW